jgi:hypothetical protein
MLESVRKDEQQSNSSNKTVVEEVESSGKSKVTSDTETDINSSHVHLDSSKEISEKIIEVLNGNVSDEYEAFITDLYNNNEAELGKSCDGTPNPKIEQEDLSDLSSKYPDWESLHRAQFEEIARNRANWTKEDIIEIRELGDYFEQERDRIYGKSAEIIQTDLADTVEHEYKNGRLDMSENTFKVAQTLAREHTDGELLQVLYDKGSAQTFKDELANRFLNQGSITKQDSTKTIEDQAMEQAETYIDFVKAVDKEINETIGDTNQDIVKW